MAGPYGKLRVRDTPCLKRPLAHVEAGPHAVDSGASRDVATIDAGADKSRRNDSAVGNNLKALLALLLLVLIPGHLGGGQRWAVLVMHLKHKL